MRRALQIAAWVLFAAISYLIFAEAMAPWIDLPGLGNIGFTVVFVLFALLHCAAQEGWARTGAFFAISAAVSFLLEEMGVRTGLIFGPYHYSDMLGAKLGHVPVLIPLAWFMMIYPSWRVAEAILRPLRAASLKGIASLALTAAFVMTAWDTVMDPGMAAAGNWTWEQGGPYFGVPLHNYFGWLLTTFLVYAMTGLAWRGMKRRGAVSAGFAFLPVLVYSLHALRYVLSNHIAALKLVALFAMGFPALLALLKGAQSGEDADTTA
ncbi:MAG TPA: carotenoid biosynthesis protein [Acidobacteriaceae bacterium]